MFAQDVDAMVEISGNFEGNADMQAPLVSFMSAFKVPGRKVSTSTLQAIGSLKMAPGEMCPHVVMTIFMVLASSPLANQITSGDVKGMVSEKKLQDLKLVEITITQMLDVVGNMDLPADQSLKIVAEFKSKLIMKFFGKVKK